MSETPPETPADPAVAWLPIGLVADWLQLDAAAPVTVQVRDAAADYCQDKRPDLWVDLIDPDTLLVVGREFVATPKVVQAGILAAGRLYARKGSPAGLASFGEFGAAEVLRLDPDVDRLLGIGRHAHPRVG